MSYNLETLNKLTREELRDIAKKHSVNSFNKNAKKEDMINVLYAHFKPRSPSKKCKEGEELTKKGNCAKKCKKDQVRNDATGRCRSKSPSKEAPVEEPKKKVSKKPSRVKPVKTSSKSSNEDLTEERLRNVGITELKKIAKEHGITSLHKYTSKNKQELIDKLKVEKAPVEEQEEVEVVEEQEEVVEEPKKKVSKKPSRVKTSSKSSNEDLTEERLLNVGITELKKIAKEHGITSLHKYTSKNKQELIDKLKVEEPIQPQSRQPSPPVSPKKCNPYRNEFCDDDEYCETPANICVKNKGDFEEFTINGKKIIGSKESIDALKKHLNPPIVEDEKPTVIPRRFPPVGKTTSSSVEKDGKDGGVKRDKPVVKKSDLESMLKDLDVDVKNDLSKLNDLQKELLTCLFGK
jgi:hypothetical protein